MLVRLRVKCGRDFVIFGRGRREAVTACGLRTEDPLFVLDRGVWGGYEARREQWPGVCWGRGKVDYGWPVTLQAVCDLQRG